MCEAQEMSSDITLGKKLHRGKGQALASISLKRLYSLSELLMWESRFFFIIFFSFFIPNVSASSPPSTLSPLDSEHVG